MGGRPSAPIIYSLNVINPDGNRTPQPSDVNGDFAPGLGNDSVIVTGFKVPIGDRVPALPTLFRRPAPEFNAEINDVHTGKNRPIRVYQAVDQRFIHEDFFAKLARWLARRRAPSENNPNGLLSRPSIACIYFTGSPDHLGYEMKELGIRLRDNQTAVLRNLSSNTKKPPNSRRTARDKPKMNPLESLMPIINAHAPELKTAGVISIRPGYKMKNGWPTKDPAIVVIVSKNAPNVSLPSEIQDIPIDIRKATDVEELRFSQPEKFARIAAQRAEFRDGAFPELDPAADEAMKKQLADLAAAAKPEIPYTAPDGVLLNSVSGNFPLTCHASPDAGWPTLRAFLAGTESTLTVGMYDFTSKHILDEVKSDLLGKQQLEIVLDNPAKNPTADQTDTQTLETLGSELGDELQSAWALVRSNKAVHRWIFPTAYHIKVAVRDSQTMWLSSGNWNNSNQPDIDPIEHPSDDDQKIARKSDRDWHVVIEEPRLAKTYEAFLKHDFAVASGQENGAAGSMAEAPEVELPESAAVAAGEFQFHKPLRIENEAVTVTPLLTPDPGIYQPAMLRMVSSAQNKLYIQLQYIHPSDKDQDADFAALINAVIERIQANVDVRIILSQWQISHGWLERLQAAGVDLGVVKIQNGVHNKGFVVDSQVVALGSQNWSAEGVLRNRDASVIIENQTAAKYFEQIFLHDWDRIAKQNTQQ